MWLSHYQNATQKNSMERQSKAEGKKFNYLFVRANFFITINEIYLFECLTTTKNRFGHSV